MNLIRRFGFTFMMIFSVIAFADGLLYNVTKTDGNIGHYRFLPVHYDPAHAAIVASRLAETKISRMDLPSQYQIDPSQLPPIRDQGSRGTCTYFSSVGMIETYYLAQSPIFQGMTLSEECLADVRDWMYDQGSKYTGDDAPILRPDPDGDYPERLLQTVSERGIPMAVVYSPTLDCTYNGSNVNGTDVSLSDYISTFANSLMYGAGLIYNENNAPTIDAVRAQIANNSPVVVAILVYYEFMNEVNWLYNPAVDTGAHLVGGHSVLLTGYSTQNGKTIFTFKNSWGANWGNGGYGTLNDDLLTNSWAYQAAYDFIVSINSN